MITSAEIVKAARRYIGAPLAHQGRISSLDCIGLVLAVAEDLGLRDRAGRPIRRLDYGKYAKQPGDGFLVAECNRRLEPAWPLGDSGGLRGALRAGMVVTLRMRSLDHAAILGELAGELSLIHAHGGVKKVAEHRIDDAWLRRITGIFRFPRIDN